MQPLIFTAALSIGAAACGFWFARRCGLQIRAHDLKQPVIASFAIGALVAAYLLLVDFTFRPVLAASYTEFLTQNELSFRLAYFTIRSTFEGVIYQLFFGSMFVFALGRIWRDGDRIAPGAYWVGLLAAHALNLAINVPLEFSTLPYVALRFFMPGVLWALLYRRNGLAVVLGAHAATHVFFQPVISHLLLA